MQVEKLSRDHFLIQELINSYREDWQYGSGQRDKEKRKYFYMSDVSKCDREIYYLFHSPEQKRTIADKTLILFCCGNLHHEEIQFRLKKRRIVESSRDLEFGIEDWEVEATGRLDGFARDNGALTVTEIKAKNPYGFLNEEPEDYEADQILWYIYAARNSKNLRKRKINDFGYILYFEGWPISDFPIAGWRIEYDEERVKQIRERFKNLKLIIEAKKIPQRPHERDSVKCQYCRFLDFCWKGIPLAKEPKLVANPSIEKPEKELVESAENRYVELKTKEAEIKSELEEVRTLLFRYFKATGQKETDKILYCFSKRINLDNEYLLKNLKDKFHLIAKPQLIMIKKAIEAGQVDPEIFERAKKVEFSEYIKIKKGVLNANKKS